MKFSAVVEQVLELLQRQGRISYRTLKREFDLDDEYVEDLKTEIIKARKLARDEEGEVLVWTGTSPVSGSKFQGSSSQEENQKRETRNEKLFPSTQHPDARREGERRQLTVKFIDLVGSTTLSEQLDPEELRTVIQKYRATCATVIGRCEGYVAKYIGDGLLVYFGYPQAHEDDAQRAVRAGLGIVAALPQLNAELQSTLGAHGCASLQVRIGIHTGLVVAGEMGTEDQPEPLAIVGETPNIAARVEGKAEPNTVVISQATHRLVQGLFECKDLGPQALKGLSTPLSLYRVVGDSGAQSRFAVAVQKGLTPLVGREPELGLLRASWEHAKAGADQVVLLSGEPGIGKSRLVQELKEQLEHEGATRIEFRCSPYHQNSALYPIIDHLQRLLQFDRADTPQAKLSKLRQALCHYRFPQADTLPLLAALLSLPHPEGCAPLTFSPQKQKQKTQEALVAWLREEAERNAVYTAWEDLHWADPSTLELVQLYLEQIPTTRMFTVLTFRPDFVPPWGARSCLTQLTLSRLGRQQVETMVEQVTGGKSLPTEVVQQIVAKTDGVPLFVEELTKMVLESGLLTEGTDHYELRGALPPLAIPATLQDSLMARLDRLAPVREIAQVGATLGREFSYEVLHAVSPLDEATLEQGLRQLVEAELIYQRGLPPQASYLFKHALIQDTAYQSLLKSTRQQLHQRSARVLEERFPEVKETQPELVAHHYTEAGLIEQALPYWQQAGQRANQRSAYVEAVAHLTKGLALLKTLPDTPERSQQELALQTILVAVLSATKGLTASEKEQVYARALELCRQVGESPQLAPVLCGLAVFYQFRGELQTQQEVVEQLLRIAQSVQDPAFLALAHMLRGEGLYFRGELLAALDHLEQGLALYDPQQFHTHGYLSSVFDVGVYGRCFAAAALGALGYPDQALRRVHEALTLARAGAHSYTLALALNWVAVIYLMRGEVEAVQERAAALVALATEQELPDVLAFGTIWQGWARVQQGEGEAGIGQIRQGLAHFQAAGFWAGIPGYLAMLAEAYMRIGQIEEGLSMVAEALTVMDKTGERTGEAGLYVLKGWLLFFSQGDPAAAEACFQQAIDIARRRSAKSGELLAVTSLSRLWQMQGKKDEARQMLAEIYGWFTEGFDTKALQEAKALLDELA
jgi:predicted ATPase/class 3 adenylate cyclase